MATGGKEIEMTAGISVSTTRKTLKQELERYGEIEICHMGERHVEPMQMPWVRYAKPESAEAALGAIKQGIVFVDGVLLQADWRTSKNRPAPRAREADDRGG
eukprot:CAMPEP_0183573936 /NCGR_PEP_ID=MMETSP0371-20130417/132185_1 /TAXON_ID=268820 /ORGANISM="Peridinium aciculiferum, Strain PAER-2" /LENGTH=101 /DNA_ID=CAMNT_0025783965 /DNA_START=33 /DNA_END=335 /DNA_ORIENTATION=+